MQLRTLEYQRTQLQKRWRRPLIAPHSPLHQQRWYRAKGKSNLRSRQTVLFPNLLQLPLAHAVEHDGAPKLGGCEDNMQDGRHDLEDQGPSTPQATEQPHYDGSLGSCAGDHCDAANAEHHSQECVPLGVNAVQDDGDMW